MKILHIVNTIAQENKSNVEQMCPHICSAELILKRVQESPSAVTAVDACTSLKLNCSVIISSFAVCLSHYPFLKFFRPLLLFSILNEETQMDKMYHRQPWNYAVFTKEGMKSCSFLIYECPFSYTTS